MAKRPLKTRRRSPKRQKSPMTLSTMPSVLQKGTFKTSGMYSSTLGKTKKMEWDTTIDSSRDGATMTFSVNKDNVKLSGDLNAVVKNNIASLKGTINKNGKVHQVDMKDLNLLDQMSMYSTGAQLATMLK
jgi:hypothetical protein